MLNVIHYKRPDGRPVEVTIKNIRQEDAKFFIEGNLFVSMEDLMTGDVVLYSETGMSDEDGEEIEVMYLVPQGESCEDAMSELRKLVELKWED